MKKIVVFLGVITFTIATVAQKPFTKETFAKMLDEYKKNSKSFFMDRLSTDFRSTNRQGAFEYRKGIVSEEPQKIVSTEIIQPVIIQSGDVAVVTGIHKTIRVGNDGNQET